MANVACWYQTQLPTKIIDILIDDIENLKPEGFLIKSKVIGADKQLLLECVSEIFTFASSATRIIITGCADCWNKPPVKDNSMRGILSAGATLTSIRTAVFITPSVRLNIG